MSIQDRNDTRPVDDNVDALPGYCHRNDNEPIRQMVLDNKLYVYVDGRANEAWAESNKVVPVKR